ncbi:MAG: hypothetical protein GY847_33605 [Proteobacteria bacterium]|nr:hypothetical protein [Pseudomonadota bacterium]
MVNRMLLRRLVSRLKAGGARVLISQDIPPGDGGISDGQAACAACILDEEV